MPASPMPMAGMPMPAREWLGAYPIFVARWAGMMAAMMLPSLLPRLWSYARALHGTGPARAGALVAVAGAGYVAVWGGLGALIYPATAALAAVAAGLPTVARSFPMLIGTVVAAAGVLQFTAWKLHHLACWRAPVTLSPAHRYDAGSAWSYGSRLALHCSCCGAGLTAVLLVLGVMDPRSMAVATAAVTVERLAPGGVRVARAFGLVGVGAGLLMIARAAVGA